MDDALRFLARVFATKDESHQILVWTLPDKSSWWFTDPAKAATFAAANQTRNVYFGCGLRGKSFGRAQRGEAADVVAVHFLWADLDYGTAGHEKTRLPPDEASARSLLGECGLMPTITVHSGHGLQAYWLLKEPALEMERAARAAELWTRAIQFRAKAHGWEVDSVFDLARVMRVPGTQNVKGTPVPCRILDDAGPEYAGLDDFEPYFIDPAAYEGMKRERASVGAVTVGDRPSLPPRFEALCLNSEEFRMTWERSRLMPNDNSRSGYDQSLANHMALAGFTDQEMADVIVGSWRKHGDPDKSNRDAGYVERTIGNARVWASTRLDSPLTVAANGHAPAVLEPETLVPLVEAPEASQEAAAPPATPPVGPGPGGPGGGPQQGGGGAVALPPFEPTDLVFARRFVAEHGSNLRYCHPWGQWLIWTGRHWEIDEADHAVELVKVTVETAVNSAIALGYKKLAERLRQWHSRDKIMRAILSLAQSEPGIPVLPHQLDANSWALNCQNGILDLKTGQLQPHDRSALCTKIVPVDYDPNARSAIWEDFVALITDGDPLFADFLQRACGYSLTGDTRERKLFFCYGPTHTGKTTFLEAVARTIGPYAMTADFSTFLVKDVNSIRTDIARLRGARFVKSVEATEGSRFAEGLLKMVTGGDMVTARQLYQKEFEYLPQFKIWLAANKAPQAPGDDDALWSRIRRIPFQHSFDTEEHPADPSIKERLTDPSLTGKAILRWMVLGCLEWQATGLQEPAIVTADTKQYQSESDPLLDYSSDELIFDSRYFIVASRLQKHYADWCKNAGIRYPLTPRKFGNALRRHGCHRAVNRIGATTVRVWRGVTLQEDSGSEGDG